MTALRKKREDGERNRARLLEVAKSVLAEKGGKASLDEIARLAGVGAGTLYRHFPTRDALVAAVYRNECDQLFDAADRLGREAAPVAALQAWLRLFVDYIVAKQGMYALLNTLEGGTSELYAETTARMTEAAGKLVARGVEAGVLRVDVAPIDLLRAIAGVANVAAGVEGEQAAKAVIDILIAGMRRDGEDTLKK